METRVYIIAVGGVRTPPRLVGAIVGTDAFMTYINQKLVDQAEVDDNTMDYINVWVTDGMTPFTSASVDEPHFQVRYLPTLEVGREASTGSVHNFQTDDSQGISDFLLTIDPDDWS